MLKPVSEKVVTPAGVCSAPLHIQQPGAGAVDCGRKQRTLQSGLMKLSMISSAVTEEKWAACSLFIRAAPWRLEEAHSDCLRMNMSGYMPKEPQ